MLYGQTNATLSTLARQPEGYPFGSIVRYVTEESGAPWLLISAMAEHTSNAKADPRASLLVSATSPAGTDPLASARATLIGTMLECTPTAQLRKEFLRRNPGAQMYVDYPDFSWWRLEPISIRYVGGFGQMSWVDAEEFSVATPDPIAPHTDAICSHMNMDHSETHRLLLNYTLGRTDVLSATMSGVDRLGCDFETVCSGGRYPLRLPFVESANSTEEVRAALVAMISVARSAE